MIGCSEYVPKCIIDELKRLNDEIELLKKNKVTVTKIMPTIHQTDDNETISGDGDVFGTKIPPQNLTVEQYKEAIGECPLGLPDPPDAANNG